MSGPYSRVYWSVMDDPKFDGVREDCRLFGAWSLLLVVADMAWPAPAFVPPTVPRSALARLVSCGLIDPLDGHRFRVHGLARERDKRSQVGRNAAALRWHSKGNADPMLDEAETRQSTDEDARASTWNAFTPGPEFPALGWLSTHRATLEATGNGLHRQLVRLVEQHGSDKVIATFEALGTLADARQYVFGAQDRLNPIPKAKPVDPEEEAARIRREKERRRLEAEVARRAEMGTAS